MLSIIAALIAILIIFSMKVRVCPNVLRDCSTNIVFLLRTNVINAYFLVEFVKTRQFAKVVAINTIWTKKIPANYVKWETFAWPATSYSMFAQNAQ